MISFLEIIRLSNGQFDTSILFLFYLLTFDSLISFALYLLNSRDLIFITLKIVHDIFFTF